jgi:catechol 2,3-dioxygenase-like lactoylglutathione lyase family enzyme
MMWRPDNYKRGLEMKKARVLNAALMLLGFAVLTAMAIGITTANSQSSGGTRAAVKFDHVHFMVKDLDKAMRSYEKLLGLTPTGEGGFIRDTEASRIGMLPMHGGRIELIELGAAAAGRMPRFVKEHGEGVGGLSIFLEDFDKEMATLKKKGVAVQVTNPPATKDVKYPFRLGWVEADQGHGAWIEFVDVKTIPPSERDWDSVGKARPARSFDHVHFIVKNLDEALKSYERLLGLTPGGKGGFRRDFQGTRIGMLPLHGARIEMIEPGPANSRMYRFLKERGEGVGGLSIFVEDFDNEIKGLKERGIKVELTTTPILDPKFPLRLGWVEADQGHGVWLEIVDVKTVPSYDKNWDVALFAAPSLRHMGTFKALFPVTPWMGLSPD